MKKNILLFLFCVLPLVAFSQLKINKSVRVVYLVSADREIRNDYADAIRMAALNVQAWYKKQMGTTFKLNDPILEIVQSDKNAEWFSTNPNGENKDYWGYYNSFQEVQLLLNARYFGEEYTWVIYSDSPHWDGKGGSGVCCLPERDIQGLMGLDVEQPEINRWIAGLGHEIGHAFGLSHPADMKKDADAIMATGIYGKYPDICYLTQADKDILNNSSFFFNESGIPNSGKEYEVTRYEYSTGYFIRFYNEKTQTYRWSEIKKDNSEKYGFTEQEMVDNVYKIKSVNRKLWITIPLNGGDAQLSTDEIKWNFFQKLTLLQ